MDKIIIDTELRAEGVTRGTAEIQKDIDAVIKAQEKLQAKFDKAKALEVKADSKQMRGMQYEAMLLEERLENLQSEFDKAFESEEPIKQEEEHVETLREKIERLAKSVDDVGKKAKKAHKSFNVMKVLKYTLGIRSLFVLTNKLRRAMVDGFTALAKFNDGVNPVNTALSNLKSSMGAMKGSFAAAFAPILTIVEPLLTRMIDGLTNAMTMVGRFIAALTGAKTFTQAKKTQVDYAKSLDGTAKSAKNAKNQLASFYDLNVLDTKQDDSGGAGGASSTMDFEEVAIDSKTLEMADKIKTIFAPALGLATAAVNAFKTAWEIAKPIFEWVWDNVLVPFGEWTGELFKKGMEKLTEILQKFSAWCKDDESNINLMTAALAGFFLVLATYLIAKKVQTLLPVMAAAFSKFVLSLSAGLSPIALAALAIGVLAAGIIYLSMQWDKLTPKQRTITLLGSLAAAATAAAVAIAIFHTAWSVGVAAAAIAAGLALLGLTFAFSKSNSKAHGGAGQSFYSANDFSKSPLPGLATGTVVPRSARPFAAVLGDNNKETEVVSPLSTMKQAFLEAMKEGGGQRVNVYLEGDAAAVFKLVRTESDRYTRETGEFAF